MFAMKPFLIAFPLIIVLSGCMTVLGYEPTPAELEMIKRGEDPRANEGETDERTGGESAVAETKAEEERPIFEADQSEGPRTGTVLRWLNSDTLIVEADSKREVVVVANMTSDLDALMDTYTYGTQVSLTYPRRNARGEVIYRDDQGRLLANIR